MKPLAAAAAALVLAACSAPGPILRTPPGPRAPLAMVIFMRAPGVEGAPSADRYYVDRTLVAELQENRYTHVVLPAGTYRLHCGDDATDPRTLLTVDLQPGQLYSYQAGSRFRVHSSVARPAAASAGARARLLSRAEAEVELRGYRYQKPLLEEVVPDDARP